jgi:hypothetical protein
MLLIDAGVKRQAGKRESIMHAPQSVFLAILKTFAVIEAMDVLPVE